MADFYDDLDLDIEGYDPDDPSDPINVLLEKIREAQADKSPKAYVLNEKNLKRFMIVYKNVDLLVEAQDGKYLDIKTDPRNCDFAIIVEFPFLSLIEEDLVRFRKIAVVADAVDLDPSSDNSILLDIQVKDVYTSVAL